MDRFRFTHEGIEVSPEEAQPGDLMWDRCEEWVNELVVRVDPSDPTNLGVLLVAPDDSNLVVHQFQLDHDEFEHFDTAYRAGELVGRIGAEELNATDSIVAYQRLWVQRHRDDRPPVTTPWELDLLDLSYSGDTSSSPSVRVLADVGALGPEVVISCKTIDNIAWHLMNSLEGHYKHGVDGHVGFRPVCWDWWYLQGGHWAARPDEYNIASPLVLTTDSPTLVEIFVLESTVRSAMRDSEAPIEKVCTDFVGYLLARYGHDLDDLKWKHLFIK